MLAGTYMTLQWAREQLNTTKLVLGFRVCMYGSWRLHWLVLEAGKCSELGVVGR